MSAMTGVITLESINCPPPRTACARHADRVQDDAIAETLQAIIVQQAVRRSC